MSVGSQDVRAVRAAPGRLASPPRRLRAGRLSDLLDPPLLAILAAAAVLRFTDLGGVAGNDFYDAAVRSMSLSAHNFLYGAFDPGGFLAIDKPPLDLWLQALSTSVLGWGSFALKLPEALAGTLAVPLLYDIVRRVCGRPAALAAATVLALAPEAVLTARSDTMDAVMMLLMLAALGLTVAAARSGERRTLVLAGVALGLAFEIKLLEALVCLPALGLLYLLAAPVPLRRRVVDLLLGAAALVLVGLAWAVVVSVLPGHHPWPVGSTNGTVWNAMFVFNGAAKVSTVGGQAVAGGPGLFRLVVADGWHYDQLFGCVFVPALVVGGVALARAVLRGGSSQGGRRNVSLGGPDALSLQSAFVVAVAVWMLVGLVVFDTMTTVHARYLDAFSPALAMSLGLGAASLAGFDLRGRAVRRPQVWLTVLALAGACAYTFHFRLASVSWGTVALLVAVLGAGLLATAGGRWLRSASWLVAGLAVACVLALPVHETLRLVRSDENDSLGLAVVAPAEARALSDYLQPRTAGLRYELAVDEPLSLAPVIIADRRPILPLTSFAARPLVGLHALQRAVRTGRVRYGLVRRYACGGPNHRSWAACTPAARWIRATGVDVTRQAGLTGRLRLYRLGR